MRNPPMAVEQGEGSRPGSIGKEPKRTRSSQPRRKNTGSERSGRGQSPACRSPDRSRTPDKSRTPVRRHTSEWETTSGKGVSRARGSSPPECMMLEAAPTTSKAAPNTTRAISIQEPELPMRSELPEPQPGVTLHKLRPRQTPAAQTHVDRTPWAEGTRNSEEKIHLSPKVRRVLTRLQHVASPGASSLNGGLDANYKEKVTPKKPRPS